ncbi:hypothetical protein [uncultured Alsobacter sp.]|uniref:hypothetical protein n=1 Tax=uncultured Alsobacter sp. TaxID=1748258 RepID=UPI0025FAAA21|nr:hypothetical protein [uncultured Alsobacter sp.]
MKRLLLALLLAFGLGVPAGAGAAPLIGAYVWGGLLGGRSTPDAFNASVAFLLDRGFTAIRFAVGPKTLEGYGFAPGACGPRPSLACMLDPFLKAGALDDPRLRLVMITLHDSFVTRAGAFDPATVARDAEAILSDHAAALASLDRRFAGRPVRIVLSNWEGDNQLFCGSAYTFSRSPDFVRTCSATRGDLSTALQGFIDWIALRDRAIAAYRKGGGTLDVSQAPEVNNLRIFTDGCLTTCDTGLTLAAGLRARGGWATCSYSAYDGINAGRLGETLDRLASSCRRTIIGEFGFPLDRVKGERLKGLYASAAAAIAQRQSTIDAVFIWNAFESEGTRDTGYGLFRADGSPFAWNSLPEAWRDALRVRQPKTRGRSRRRRKTDN